MNFSATQVPRKMATVVIGFVLIILVHSALLIKAGMGKFQKVLGRLRRKEKFSFSLSKLRIRHTHGINDAISLSSLETINSIYIGRFYTCQNFFAK